MKQYIPWQIRIVAKIILSRLPFNYRLWESMDLFKHGHMKNPEYALQVFEEHFNRVDFQRKNDNFVALELGPGDSLFSSIIARSFGAKRCYMVDVGAYASMEKKPYEALVKLLEDKGVPIDIDAGSSVSDLIEECGGVYCTEGLKSLKAIPDQSVDFIWSQAVLEHIRFHEFKAIMNELRRVLRTGGVCSHRVDLKDHLGGGVNNLRLGSHIWETDWMASSGFYTNRIRFNEMINRFVNAGFDVHVIKKDKWPEIPISRQKMAAEFGEIDDEDLLVSGFDVTLTISG